jgi:hypothetical protein
MDPTQYLRATVHFHSYTRWPLHTGSQQHCDHQYEPANRSFHHIPSQSDKCLQAASEKRKKRVDFFCMTIIPLNIVVY